MSSAAAVLLHEWAHTLVAIHDRAPDNLMALSYEAEQRLHARPVLRDLQARFQSRFGARLVPALYPAGWTAR